MVSHYNAFSHVSKISRVGNTIIFFKLFHCNWIFFMYFEFMLKTEKVKTLGGFDCFGNLGFVTTNKNQYVFDMYEQFPWKRMKDGVRGLLHLDKNKACFVSNQSI